MIHQRENFPKHKNSLPSRKNSKPNGSIVNSKWLFTRNETNYNPGVRQDASVHKNNPFLFANKKKSCSHVKGCNAVKSVSVQAGIRQNITATSIRDRASIIYASLDVPESERQTFYQHMGHSQEINKNVYQAPLAVQEVTKVDWENWIAWQVGN